MKRFICALAALLLCITCLASCAVKFEYVDGRLVNGRTKEEYNALPMGFEPCGVGEAYGEFGAFTLYRLTDLDGNEMDPEIWLTEEYSGSATTVFLNESSPVPSFRDMTFDVCYLCEEDVSVISIATIESSDEIKEIISALDGEKELFRPEKDVTASYTLKFYSAEYPAVFYSVDYYVTKSGNYLHDKASDTCVEIGDMLSEYVVVEDE
ncbi:MAG: hypothetical protein E7660_00390 [Ruminococcaceae bacterium]|nr:hypothetical protein [Oscillospiraceae bacterium]